MARGEELELAAIASRRAPCALLTRPRDDAGSLAAALAERGVDVVIEPMMEIHYRPTAMPDFTGVQALLCTSANGVRALAQITGERHRPLLAVGDATASRARGAGFTDVASAAGSIDDLVRLTVTRLRPQAGKLVHVAGTVVAGDLAGALRAQGFTIDRIILYEARPVAALSKTAVHALRSGTVDFALFFSARTAAIFVKLASRTGLAECCQTITALAISPTVDEALSTLSWRDRQIAAKPSQPALLDRLDRVLRERHQGLP